MADYSYQELMHMQNDAIRRAEDMRRRARTTAGLDTPSEPPAPPQEPKRIPMPGGYLQQQNEVPQQEQAPPTEKSPLSEELKNGLGEINMDSDKALLLSLIMLLSQEGADELLLMALIYILA